MGDERLGERLGGAGPTADELFAALMQTVAVRNEIHASGWSRTAWTAADDARLLSALLPATLGGPGGGFGALVDTFMAIGRHHVPGPYAERAVALAMLAGLESDGPRLFGLVSGAEPIAVLDAAMFPGGGLAAQPRVTGQRVTGSVGCVPYGAEATHLLVVAEADDGPVVALLGADAPGVAMTEQASFDTSARNVRVGLDDAPIDALVVPGAAGAAGAIDHVRAGMRLVAACEMAGLARQMLEHSVSYAKARRQFGRSIGTLQAVQHLLADMCVDVVTLEAACRRGADRAERSPEEAVRQSIELKALASGVVRSVGEGAMQVHGGVAFTRQHDLHRWFARGLELLDCYGDERALARDTGLRLLAGGALSGLAR